MYIKNATVAPLLAGAIFLLTGFSWNFGGDPCQEAVDLAKQLPTVADELNRNKNEQKITELCPDGAAAKFVTGTRLERSGNLDGAVASYRRALVQNPELAAASGNLGMIYLQKGLLDEAAVALTKGVNAHSVPAWHKALGRIMTEKKFYSLALYHYGEAAAKTPLDADVVAGQAEVYAALGQADRAADEFRRALLLDPGHEQAAVSISKLYMMQNQHDKAFDVLKGASVAHPQNNEMHLMLADIYEKRGDTRQAEYERLLGGKKAKTEPAAPVIPEGLALGDKLAAKGEIDKAAVAYRSAINQQPDSVEPFEKLGNLFFNAGRDADAIIAYREAVHRLSSNADVYYNLGLLYEKRNQMDEAVVSFKRAVEKRPAFADARLRLADIRLARGNTQEAIEQYVEFLRLKPESADIHLKLARIFVKNKSLALAEESYKSVLSLAPDNVDAHREMAFIYRTKGSNDKAVTHLKKLLELQKSDADARNDLTTIYVKEKKYDELFALLKETVELAPDDANNHYKLGLIYDFRKDYEGAIASYKKATELKPEHAKALHALGRVYIKTGRLPEAREVLESARKADPNMEETAVLLNNIRDEFNPVPRKGKGKASKKSKGKAKGKAAKKDSPEKKSKPASKAKKNAR